MDKKDKKVPKELKIFMVIVVTILSLVIVGFLSSLINQYQVELRNTERQKVMTKINTVIVQNYEEFNQYPEAVFFSQDRVLICMKSDCLISEEFELEGSTKSAADNSNKSDRYYTKYSYQLDNDGYKLAYCDENANVINYGTLDFDQQFSCN